MKVGPLRHPTALIFHTILEGLPYITSVMLPLLTDGTTEEIAVLRPPVTLHVVVTVCRPTTKVTTLAAGLKNEYATIRSKSFPL